MGKYWSFAVEQRQIGLLLFSPLCILFLDLGDYEWQKETEHLHMHVNIHLLLFHYPVCACTPVCICAHDVSVSGHLVSNSYTVV